MQKQAWVSVCRNRLGFPYAEIGLGFRMQKQAQVSVCRNRLGFPYAEIGLGFRMQKQAWVTIIEEPQLKISERKK